MIRPIIESTRLSQGYQTKEGQSRQKLSIRNAERIKQAASMVDVAFLEWIGTGSETKPSTQSSHFLGPIVLSMYFPLCFVERTQA